jgi:hypothetical protein
LDEAESDNDFESARGRVSRAQADLAVYAQLIATLVAAVPPQLPEEVRRTSLTGSIRTTE